MIVDIVRPAPLGGGNNQCWFRTALQVLLSCPPFINIIKTHQGLIMQKNDDICKVLLDMINDSSNINQYQHRLLQVLRPINPIFSSGNQEDAGQAITIIIDNIKVDEIKNVFVTTVEHLVIIDNDNRITVNETPHTTLELPRVPLDISSINKDALKNIIQQYNMPFIKSMLMSHQRSHNDNDRLKDHPNQPIIKGHVYRMTSMSRVMLFTNTGQFDAKGYYYFPVSYKLKDSNGVVYIFDLMGVGIYSGSGSGGHWYAQGYRYTDDGTDGGSAIKWYQLNDSYINHVTNHTISKLWLLKPMVLAYCCIE